MEVTTLYNKEVWKDIYFVENGILYDYRGLYLVSNWGRVKSLNYRQSKKTNILKITKDKKWGYWNVSLTKEKKRKTFKVHRLVAYHFILNPNNLPEVNHKDENKDNNCYSNLEWCSSKYNARYSKSKKVNQYDLEGNLIKTWECIEDAKEKLNIIHISDCCKGKRKTAGGYIWKYHVE